MPRTRSLAWSELKIGILAIAAVAIASALIFMLGGQGGFFWQRYHLKTRFANVATLKPGSPVRVAGVESGSVTDIQFAGVDVEVLMEVSKSVQDRVRSGSVATVGSVSLLGEGAVDISASLQGEPLPEWGYVRSGRAAQLSDAVEQGTRGLEQATLLIQDLRQGRGTLGRLVSDESLYRDIQGFVTAAEDITRTLQRGRGTMGRLLQDPAAAKALEASLQNLNAVTARLNSGEGSLGRLLKDDAFARSLASATANADSLTGKLTRGEGTAGKLVNDATLYNRLDSVTNRLDQLMAQLNAGRGSAGQLLHDKQLYDNMNAAASELRGLVGDIRKDPRKYLNVKVSIF